MKQIYATQKMRIKIKICRKKMIGMLINSILFFLFTSIMVIGQEDPYRRIELGSTAGYGTRVQEYKVPEGFPQFEVRTRFIGNIRGTWYEMGLQYGKRAGDLIRYVYDYWLKNAIERFGLEHLKEDLTRYAKEIDLYSPEMTKFLKGIAEGASEDLHKSPYKEKLNDFEKIILINVSPPLNWMHPKSEFHKGKTTPMPKKNSMHISSASKEICLSCTGTALCGKPRISPKGELPSPTRNGVTIITQNMDAGYAPWAWNVAYVATPSDPEANVFWSISTAGMAGGNNMVINNKGLGLGLYTGGQSDDPDDFGIVWQPLYVYTIAYANNAREAIELLTQGSPEYRTKTGRKIVRHAGRWGYMVADPDEVAMVEVTSHRYAVRYPGETNEKGNYIVYANFYRTNHYFNENNVKIEKPIGTVKSSSKERYYTFDWHIKYHFGDLDICSTKEMLGMRFYYDKDTGRRIEFLEDGVTPLHLTKHTPNYNKNDTTGTVWASCAILRKDGKTEIWWTKGNPADWLGPWQHTDFAGYGK